jgi:hypothetical protein
VDYLPPLTILGAGRYIIEAEYRNTTSRASYPAQYVVHHAGGTTTVLKSQLDGTSGAYVSFTVGDFDLGSTGWVRVNDTGCQSITFNRMRFTYLGPATTKATSPIPAHLATGVGLAPTLSWFGGVGATSHDVYFGTSSPGTFRGNQPGTTFNPGPLSPNTAYFWRIDEINGSGTVTGDAWSFTTGSGTFTYSTQYEFDADPSTAAGVIDASAGDANGSGLLTKSGTGYGNSGGGIAGGVLRFVDSSTSNNYGYHFAGNGGALSFTIDMRVKVNAGVSGTNLRRSMGFSGGSSKNIGLRLHKTNEGNTACTDGSVRFVAGTGGTGTEGCAAFATSFRRLRVSANAATNTFKVFDLDAATELSSASGSGGTSLAWATEINSLGGYHIGSISASNTTLTDFEVDYFRVLLGTAVEDANTVIQLIPPPCTIPPSINSITPSVGRQSWQMNGVVIQGANLGGTTSVKLTQAGQPDVNATILVANGSSVTCNLDLSQVAVGLWNVVVKTTDNCPAGTLDNGFQIKPVCNSPRQDTDEDGDVDLLDYAVLQACFNGPNRSSPDTMQCMCSDADDDDDIDVFDLGVFQVCFNGPGLPVPQPACDNANGIDG